ncbi:MAG: hypothetical protein JWP66_54 [Naasia sp.]|nr:hypothetical protein [Naasia sp.]
MSVPGTPSPYGSFAAEDPGPRPATVEISFWLYLATAVLGLVGIVASLTAIDQAREVALRQLESQGQEVDPALVEGAILTGVVLGVVIGVLFTVAWIVGAILLRRGMGWARWVLLALTVLSLPGIFSTSIIAILGVLLPVAATVLAFLAASLAWYRRVRDHRVAQTRRF